MWWENLLIALKWLQAGTLSVIVQRDLTGATISTVNFWLVDLLWLWTSDWLIYCPKPMFISTQVPVVYSDKPQISSPNLISKWSHQNVWTLVQAYCIQIVKIYKFSLIHLVLFILLKQNWHFGTLDTMVEYRLLHFFVAPWNFNMWVNGTFFICAPS